MAISAPSHTHGLSFTWKPLPMNNSSPHTFLTEAVVAASGPGGGAGVAGGGGRGGEREAARCSCAEDREDGRGRPCALQRQVLAVLRVRSGRASASVRLQRVGLSSCDAETGAYSQVQLLGPVAVSVVVWRWYGGRGRGGRRLRLLSGRV